MRTIPFLFLLGLVTVACASQTGTPAETDQEVEIPEEGEPVVAEELLSRQTSGLREAARRVIRNAEEWADFWQDVHADVTPLPEVPEVDFQRHMIVAAAMGERSSGGFSISIPRVRREGTEVHAVVEEVAPGAGCMTIQVLTAPVVAVRISRAEGPVHFTERTETRDCT